MPIGVERLNVMILESHVNQSETDADNILTISELIEIAIYTVQKINNYPKSLGKTVDNYFYLLFPDEIKSYLVRQDINSISLTRMSILWLLSDNLDESEAYLSGTYASKEGAADGM